MEEEVAAVGSEMTWQLMTMRVGCGDNAERRVRTPVELRNGLGDVVYV
jgi:hypothetical protein